MKVTLIEFLKEYKLKLIIRRNIHNPYQYSCEILNAWMKHKYFYINVYGKGNTEIEAINDFITNINGKVLFFNIDNKNKKRILKVPSITLVREDDECLS